MQRSDVLKAAGRLISFNRQADYGDPNVNFAHIAERWSQHVGTTLQPWQVAAMMCDLKLARMASTQTPHCDSLIDLAGYAALAGELSDAS